VVGRREFRTVFVREARDKLVSFRYAGGWVKTSEELEQEFCRSEANDSAMDIVLDEDSAFFVKDLQSHGFTREAAREIVSHCESDYEADYRWEAYHRVLHSYLTEPEDTSLTDILQFGGLTESAACQLFDDYGETEFEGIFYWLLYRLTRPDPIRASVERVQLFMNARNLHGDTAHNIDLNGRTLRGCNLLHSEDASLVNESLHFLSDKTYWYHGTNSWETGGAASIAQAILPPRVLLSDFGNGFYLTPQFGVAFRLALNKAFPLEAEFIEPAVMVYEPLYLQPENDHLGLRLVVDPIEWCWNIGYNRGCDVSRLLLTVLLQRSFRSNLANSCIIQAVCSSYPGAAMRRFGNGTKSGDELVAQIRKQCVGEPSISQIVIKHVHAQTLLDQRLVGIIYFRIQKDKIDEVRNTFDAI